MGDIDALAKWIMENVPGEPSQNEGAVDCAIRIMDSALAENARLKEVQDRDRRCLFGLYKRNRLLKAFLAQIAKGEGAYSRDQLTFASNTIESMKALAVQAIGEGEEAFDDEVEA